MQYFENDTGEFDVNHNPDHHDPETETPSGGTVPGPAATATPAAPATPEPPSFVEKLGKWWGKWWPAIFPIVAVGALCTALLIGEGVRLGSLAIGGIGTMALIAIPLFIWLAGATIWAGSVKVALWGWSAIVWLIMLPVRIVSAPFYAFGRALGIVRGKAGELGGTLASAAGGAIGVAKDKTWSLGEALLGDIALPVAVIHLLEYFGREVRYDPPAQILATRFPDLQASVDPAIYYKPKGLWSKVKLAFWKARGKGEGEGALERKLWAAIKISLNGMERGELVDAEGNDQPGAQENLRTRVESILRSQYAAENVELLRVEIQDLSCRKTPEPGPKTKDKNEKPDKKKEKDHD